MKERIFIEKNKKKWLRFEQLFRDKKHNNPKELSTLFVQITDDLSYARTYYPNRSVRVYLNRLASAVFLSIYTKKKTKWHRLKHFWASELPKIVYESRKDLYLSAIIFLISVAIGVFCTHINPDFPRSILGDYYVDMTLKNIENNDPMAVYKGENEITMFLGITINNIVVAFRTFLMGLIFLVGTIGILLYNGIMLGSFQYFFVQQGLFAESALTIWLHGTIEILSIVIAGGAGLVMGRGLVFPGTLTRWQALQLSAKRGVKIMIGIVPLFITAGFIEGFITRHTEVPPMVRLLFILLCLGFMVFYFVYLPYKKRHYEESKNGLERFEEDQPLELDKRDTLTNTDVISKAFRIISSRLGRWLLIVGGINMLVSGLITFLIPQNPMLSGNEYLYTGVMQYFTNILWGDADVVIRIVNVLGTAVAVLITSVSIKNAYGDKTSFAKELISPLFLRLTTFFAIVFFTFAMDKSSFIVIICLLLPAVYLIIVPQYYEEGSGRLSGLFDRLGGTLFNHYVLTLLAFVTGAILLWVFGLFLYPVLEQFGFSLFYMSASEYTTLRTFVSAFMANLVLYYAFILMHLLGTISYISQKEKHEGVGLREKFKSLFP